MLPALILIAASRIRAPNDDTAPPVTERWEQTSAIEPGVDYIIVSNGYALTSDPIKNGEEYSLSGKPVTTTDDILGGEVDASMLWRFDSDKNSTDGNYRITHDGIPLTRDTWRGEDYLRLSASEQPDDKRDLMYYTWQVIRRGDVFYLAAATENPELRNMLYFSKYSGAFIYLNNPSGMAQRLFSMKLFRFVGKNENPRNITRLSLAITPPKAGQPALGAYINSGGAEYRVVSTDWSGEPAVFAYSTAYTATVTLKTCADYIFADDAAVTVNGQPVQATRAGNALTVIISYPQTEALPVGNNAADARTLLITSDIHKYTDNLSRSLAILRKDGIYPRTVSFAGDMYTGGGGYFFTGWQDYAGLVRSTITDIFPDAQPVFTMGNHDWESLYDENFYDNTGSTFAEVYGCSRVGAIYPGGDTGAPYVIFNVGATDVTYGEYYSMFRDEDLSKLERFLKYIDGSGKFILINSHWPLHYAYNSGDREVKNAEKMIDLLNKYADRNDILFVWGHNHLGDVTMLTARKPGDEIICDKAEQIKRHIKFCYANAGAMVNSTSLLVRFDDKTLRLDYYAFDGSDTLLEAGKYVINRVR